MEKLKNIKLKEKFNNTDARSELRRMGYYLLRRPSGMYELWSNYTHAYPFKKPLDCYNFVMKWLKNENL